MNVTVAVENRTEKISPHVCMLLNVHLTSFPCLGSFQSREESKENELKNMINVRHRSCGNMQFL